VSESTADSPRLIVWSEHSWRNLNATAGVKCYTDLFLKRNVELLSGRKLCPTSHDGPFFFFEPLLAELLVCLLQRLFCIAMQW
jgi:hypothetical protein